MTKKILVTGATGYIGSHTCVALLEAGYDIIALDNLSNSSMIVCDRIQKITNREFKFYKADVRDRQALDSIFHAHTIDAAIHFAGLKAVGESTAQPLLYVDNNVSGSVVLLQALSDAHVRRFVFSSSATVYGNPDQVPVPESAPLRPANPYGQTKLMVEHILHDLAKSSPDWAIGILRYFNPAGAHPSGLIGEDPSGTPNNLMPYVAQVAIGRLPKLAVFGNDYPTPDGTGIRDYIHVVDLARGHVAALNRLFEAPEGFTVNLGTGCGYSVLEVIRAFEAASGRSLNYEFHSRRAGDVPCYFADCSRANETLGWRTELGLTEICKDMWRWQSMNPSGFHSST